MEHHSQWIGNDSIVRLPVLSPTKLIIELILKVIIFIIQIEELDIVLKFPRCRFASPSSGIHLCFRSTGCTDQFTFSTEFFFFVVVVVVVVVAKPSAACA